MQLLQVQVHAIIPRTCFNCNKLEQSASTLHALGSSSISDASSDRSVGMVSVGMVSAGMVSVLIC